MKISNDFVKKLKEGDKKVFETLYNEYAGLIKAIAYRYLQDWDEAEDLLQEVFLTVYNKIGQFKYKGAFEGWLKRITVNSALKHLKDSNKYRTKDVNDLQISEEIEEDNTNVENVEEIIKKADFSSDEILEFVAQLPTGFRIIFSMYVLENYKHKEIAKLLGISVSTSKTQLLRARKLLKNRMYKIALERLKQKEKDDYNELLGS